MQKCTYCGKGQCKNGVPSVHALDVRDGEVVQAHFVCEAMAEQLGILAPKPTSLPISSEVFDALLGEAQTHVQPQPKAAPRPSAPRPTETSCPACALTLGAFKQRGRLGCPRCYQVFRPHVVALLERVHDATAHRGRFPGRTVRKAPDPIDLTELRSRLAQAIAAEQYEEASRLRDRLRKITGGTEGDEE